MTKNGDQRDPRSTELERLLGCAHRASIFLGAEGVPFALLPGATSNQSEVASLHSREFVTFLRDEFYAQHSYFPAEARLRVVHDLLDRHASLRAGTAPPVALRVSGAKPSKRANPTNP